MVSCFKGDFRVTSPMGSRVVDGKSDFHKGVDLVGINDTTVYAIADGHLTIKYEGNGFGYYVVQSTTKYDIFYAHLNEEIIKVFPLNEKLYAKKGDKLGIMGNTGRSFGAHTHLEVRFRMTPQYDNIHVVTGIPNFKAVFNASPIFSPYESACIVESETPLSKNKINEIWKIPDSDNDIFVQLAHKIRFG